jgi:Cell division septal protein
MRERRERVSVGRGRRRLVVLALMIVAAAGAAGFVWVRSSDVFTIERLIVSPGQHVTEAQLRGAAGSALGSTLLRVDLDTLKQKMMVLAYVRDVKVYRRFPDALEIQVEEYAPAAVVQATDGRRWLVADDGRVLERGSGAPGKMSLVVPAGVTQLQAGGVVASQLVQVLPVAALLHDADIWPAAAHPVAKVVVSTYGEVALVLGGGAEVRLGEPTDLEMKLMVAAEIIDRKSREGRPIEYVDVRDPGMAVAKPKEP